jgi:hypothetical protein
LSERAQNAGKLLRSDHDQRDDPDEQEFGPTNVEHENSPATPRRNRGSRVQAAAAFCRQDRER